VASTSTACASCVTDVFASHGFRGTSMSMLTDASGLGKQSLYNALGDKEAAYLQAIECATERNAALTAAMQDAPDGRHAVRFFFSAVLAHSTGDGAADNSCILTAGLMEGVASEAIVAKLFAGLRVAARAPTDGRSLQTTVRWVLKLLDEGSPLP